VCLAVDADGAATVQIHEVAGLELDPPGALEAADGLDRISLIRAERVGDLRLRAGSGGIDERGTHARDAVEPCARGGQLCVVDTHDHPLAALRGPNASDGDLDVVEVLPGGVGEGRAPLLHEAEPAGSELGETRLASGRAVECCGLLDDEAPVP